MVAALVVGAEVLLLLQSLFLAVKLQLWGAVRRSPQVYMLGEEGRHHRWHEQPPQQPDVPSSFGSALLQGWS